MFSIFIVTNLEKNTTANSRQATDFKRARGKAENFTPRITCVEDRQKARAEELIAHVEEREAHVAKREASVAKREARVAKREARVAKREASVAKREASVAKWEARVAKREARVRSPRKPVVPAWIREVPRLLTQLARAAHVIAEWIGGILG